MTITPIDRFDLTIGERITHARTKVATATIDEYGTLTVEKFEVAL